MKIWKWPLEIADVQTLPLPKGAKLLSLQIQERRPQIWALVDETAPIEARTFHTYGTGHEIPDPIVGPFVGTYQTWTGLVFHVFESAP